MSVDQVLSAARLAADTLLALLPLLPHDKAKDVLNELSVRETNRLADAAEQLKFGSDP